MLELNKEEAALLDLIKVGALGKKSDFDYSNVNWSELYNIADKHAVCLIALDAAENHLSKMPPQVKFQWMYMAGRKMTIQENIFSSHKTVTEILDKSGCKYAVMKGLCSASYYKKPELRETGDVDFLVNKDKLIEINKILKSGGLEIINTTNDIHIEYKLNDVEVEMHHKVTSFPNNKEGQFLDDILDKAYLENCRYNIGDYSFCGVNAINHALILILHIIKHLQFGGIGIRHICDWACFIESDDFKNNYNAVCDILKKGGIYKTAVAVTKICCDYLGVEPMKMAENANENLSEKLMRDVLNSGNFGKLGEEEYYGSDIFTQKQSGGKKKANGLLVFCKTAWRPCKKHKILLPIAPFYIGIRYIFRVIKGERPKIKPIKFIKNGFRRANIYEELDLFKES